MKKGTTFKIATPGDVVDVTVRFAARSIVITFRDEKTNKRLGKFTLTLESQ